MHLLFSQYSPVLALPGWRWEEGAGHSACPTMGMKLRGLLEEYEVRKLSEVRPSRCISPSK